MRSTAGFAVEGLERGNVTIRLGEGTPTRLSGRQRGGGGLSRRGGCVRLGEGQVWVVVTA